MMLVSKHLGLQSARLIPTQKLPQNSKLLLKSQYTTVTHISFDKYHTEMDFVLQAVRTFFRTNKNTCQEWLSRIRIYVITMAMHAGMYTTVVRHATEILHELKDSENAQVMVLFSYIRNR